MAPNGSDNNVGSISAPWASYKRAQTALRPGDTLYARGGVYGPTAGQGRDWVVSGTASAPITFSAYPGETPVFDGKWQGGYFLIFSTNSWIVVNGLTMQHYDDQWGDGTVYFEKSANHITVQNNIFRDNGRTALNNHPHIYIAAGSVQYITIRNNTFQGSPGGGVHMYHPPNALHVYIYNNFFANNYWGVLLGDGATDIQIYQNTFYNNHVNVDVGNHGSVPCQQHNGPEQYQL